MKSVDLGEVPSMHRQANVVSIFKKGNRALMSNYRPISLTSIVGKLLVYYCKLARQWRSDQRSGMVAYVPGFESPISADYFSIFDITAE